MDQAPGICFAERCFAPNSARVWPKGVGRSARRWCAPAADTATRETLSVERATPTGTSREAGWAGRVADGLVVPRRPGNAGGGKEPWFESDAGRGKDMTTGQSLPQSEKVQRLQTVLHAKAKEEPDRRFHALNRQGVARGLSCGSLEASEPQWRRCRGGRRDLRAHRVELARELKDGTYTPKPVRQVLIPKKQLGKFRPLGIPYIRD